MADKKKEIVIAPPVDLDSLPTAVTATIVGWPGSGKTSLACSFPGNTALIPVEDGMHAIRDKDKFPNVKSFAMCESSDAVIATLIWLGKNKHTFHNVVIDSVSKLNGIIITEVVKADKNKPKGINQANGGYGSGQDEVAEVHRKIKRLCDRLRERKNMNVFFVSHTVNTTVTSALGDDYHKAGLRMHDKSAAHYVDDVDLVAFIDLEGFVSNAKADDNKAGKVTTDSDAPRIIICDTRKELVSKNRFGISQPLDFEMGKNPLVKYLPMFKKKKKTS